MKKRFLLRLDGDLFDTLEKWAADDLRSINAQIEYLLAESVRQAGRSRRKGTRGDDSTGDVAGKDRREPT